MASADILRAAHTKLPWSAKRSCVSDTIVDVTGPDGRTVRLTGFALANGVPNGESAENTEFVFRACNAHYQMLEALKWFIDDIDGSHTSMTDFDANVVRARAAIAAAEAEAGR